MAANITQLLGVDVFGLISMIEKAARTTSQNKEACRQITERALMIKNQLEQLQHVSRSFEHPEMWKPMKGLKSTIRRAYRLIIGYHHSSYMYKFCCGTDLANEFESVQKDMDLGNQHLNDLKIDILFEFTVVDMRSMHGNSNTIKQVNVMTIVISPQFAK
jgi:interleukin-1 receptor-associated kinase 1